MGKVFTNVVAVGPRKSYTIGNDRDVIDAVSEFMGDEFAAVLNQMMDDGVWEILEAKKILEGDKEDRETIKKLNERLEAINITLERWQKELTGRVSHSRLSKEMKNMIDDNNRIRGV